MTVGVVLGSAFDDLDLDLEEVVVHTRFGDAVLHRAPRGVVLFRHGRPHRYLPNQIPYRAHALALAELGVRSLVVTSSVGLLDDTLPLGVPMLLQDLVWLDNRLPDGSAATLYPDPHPEHGHLVVNPGLFDEELARAIRRVASARELRLLERSVDFWYAPGPRTKTAAENRVLRGLGLHVNSMTLAPEVVLAAELGMAVAGLVVGHKPSGPGMDAGLVEASLRRARADMEALVAALLEEVPPLQGKNPMYRFERS